MSLLLDSVHPSTVADRLAALARRLIEHNSLEPGSEVNALFTELVHRCGHRSGQDTAAVLADPALAPFIPALRRACSEGEYRLERAWARRVVAAQDPARELAAFPYHENYQRLTRLELSTLAGVGFDATRPHEVAFLGGGPLPLSAIMLSRALRRPVDVVEIDAEAVRLATRVAELASSRIRVVQGNALEYRGTEKCDLIVLAALVGEDRDAKRQLLEALADGAPAGCLLVVRSAQGLRTLLYPPVDVHDLPLAWRPLALTHPFDDVVNSVLVAVRE